MERGWQHRSPGGPATASARRSLTTRYRLVRCSRCAKYRRGSTKNGSQRWHDQL